MDEQWVREALQSGALTHSAVGPVPFYTLRGDLGGSLVSQNVKPEKLTLEEEGGDVVVQKTGGQLVGTEGGTWTFFIPVAPEQADLITKDPHQWCCPEMHEKMWKMSTRRLDMFFSPVLFTSHLFSAAICQHVFGC